MASITDNLKDGLKYPLYDPIKIVIIGVLYFIVMALSIASVRILLNNIQTVYKSVVFVSGNNTFVNANAFNFIPNTSIAGVIILLIIAAIISLFVSGYLYKILKSTVESKNNMPDFNDFANMFVYGIKVVVVGIVYSIVPVILTTIGLTLINTPGALMTVGAIVLIVAIILAIVLGLMGIMALNNMAANNDSLKSAFDFKGVCSLICAIGWIRFIGSIIFLVLVGLVIIFAGIAVSIIITLILSLAGEIGTTIGLIIMLIIMVLLTSYLEIVTYRFYGSLYKEAIKE